jgi:hypothetical protein
MRDTITCDATRLAQDPTREEILERCRMIRQEWTATTRRRRAGKLEHPWTIPEARISTPRVIRNETGN